MVVDDSAPIREAISRTFVRRGWRVTTAGNGVEALEAVRREPFDVVISDVNMPDRDGLWLWQEAVALRPDLQGRFVLISGEPLPDSTPPALRDGTERFRAKPVSLEALWADAQEIAQRRVSAPNRAT